MAGINVAAVANDLSRNGRAGYRAASFLGGKLAGGNWGLM
jgi:hypothetical protein